MHQILNSTEIKTKTTRLAIEILERNYSESEFILAGINNKGHVFAKLIFDEILKQAPNRNCKLARLKLNPAQPVGNEMSLDLPLSEVENKVVIVVDDVANTGRTLFYAMSPFMGILAKKIEVAVMVDRSHKSFPVQPDYFGMTLATTLQEHVEVVLEEGREGAWLK